MVVRGHRRTKGTRYPRLHPGKSNKGEVEADQNTSTLKVKEKRGKERKNENPPKEGKGGARAHRRDGKGKEQCKAKVRTHPAVDPEETKWPKERMKNNARNGSAKS